MQITVKVNNEELSLDVDILTFEDLMTFASTAAWDRYKKNIAKPVHEALNLPETPRIGDHDESDYLMLLENLRYSVEVYEQAREISDFITAAIHEEKRRR